MKFTILMGSPRSQGNTAALLAPFLEECRFLGIQTQCIHLYDKKVGPCLGCMACQDVPDSLGCVQKDDFAQIFQEMEDCDVIVLATPVYAFFCTAPMKALLDRAIYAGNKNYGRTKGAALLTGKRVASIVTCGYRPDRGADIWEEGLRRWCKHGKAEYLGMFCRRDLGKSVPFMDEEKQSGVRDFAQAIYISIRMEEV